jgi:uncharacterized protein with HEPN domain
MRENRDKIFLERIIESIERAEHHIVGFDLDKFTSDQKTYDAVLMQVMNIGEMVNRLSVEFREEHHDLPWHAVIGMRNQIAHGYFEVRTEVVWKTAQEDLPVLKSKVQKILG